MYLPPDASRRRIREAQNARNNRAEIVRGLSHGQISRRDLFKWGIFTAAGTLALKNGLSPFAGSAYAGDNIPTGTPRTPMFGVKPFTQPLPRLNLQTPHTMTPTTLPDGEQGAAWPGQLNEYHAKRLSYHTDFSNANGQAFKNPLRGSGPMEGRPPFEYFAHPRWQEYFPKVGFQLSLGKIDPGIGFHRNLPFQEPNSIWSFKGGGFGAGGTLPPPLIKMRYGEPAVVRVHNNLPQSRSENNGFGRNEPSIHNHNAHNASASDGACNAYFFSGQFYDYHWGTTLAGADTINTQASDPRASGPDGNGRLINVPGDWRELQGSLWFHDHRFFFTAENVYKGFAGALNYYSGRDRGHERLNDGVNLRLPSGTVLDWGNIDFDVNLMIADWATDPDGQLFFDIFDTDGFLGDNLHVNFAYAPHFKVLPRKYRFRLLNACMARFLKLVLVNAAGNVVPMQVIANDGNLLTNRVNVNQLDVLGPAERFDVIVDFTNFAVGEKLHLVNRCWHKDGRGPEGLVSVRNAINRRSDDPAVGPLLEFRVVGNVRSVDDPAVVHRKAHIDRSLVPVSLTEQIEVVEPVRVRHIEWKRQEPDVGNPGCLPDCGEKEAFPWAVRINGETTHSLNANRISSLIPRPNEVEHWVLENGGGGWDHPVHLHYVEGLTLSRDRAMPTTEAFQRKDVWRLGEGGTVKIQVRFSEFGGAYVTHCHNTVHEDFAMLMRFDVLMDDGSPQASIIPTPIPHPDGVTYMEPEILPEGDPRFNQEAFKKAAEKA